MALATVIASPLRHFNGVLPLLLSIIDSLKISEDYIRNVCKQPEYLSRQIQFVIKSSLNLLKSFKFFLRETLVLVQKCALSERHIMLGNIISPLHLIRNRLESIMTLRKSSCQVFPLFQDRTASFETHCCMLHFPIPFTHTHLTYAFVQQ